LAFQYGVQPHGDHDLLEPRGVLERSHARAVRLRRERGEPASLVRRLPAEQAPAAATQGECRDQALLAHRSDQPGSLADDREVGLHRISRGRAPASRREEPEPRTFLVRMTEPAPLGIAELLQIAIELIHAAQGVVIRSRVPETTGNFS
jgi:hypothetical protein